MRNDDWMSNYGWFGSGVIPQTVPVFTEQLGPVPKRIQVDKATHCIRFENENESRVTLVIEPKEGV